MIRKLFFSLLELQYYSTRGRNKATVVPIEYAHAIFSILLTAIKFFRPYRGGGEAGRFGLPVGAAGGRTLALLVEENRGIGTVGGA